MVFLPLVLFAAQAGSPAGIAPADVMSELRGCQAIEKADSRLACFDTLATRVSGAVEKGDVVILDREAVRKTRRALFGFSLPKLKIFGGRSDTQEEEPEQVDVQVASARSFGYGLWRVQMEDGAVWETTEANSRLRAIGGGQTVTIKRGAMGGYFLKVGTGPAVRARRVG